MKKKNTQTVAHVIGISVLVLILLICSILAYRVGYRVFDDPEGTSENPVSVTVEIKEGAGIVSVADFLKSKGIIKSRTVFIVQKYLFKYTLAAGTYTVDSNMSGRDILDILCGLSDQTEGGS